MCKSMIINRRILKTGKSSLEKQQCTYHAGGEKIRQHGIKLKKKKQEPLIHTVTKTQSHKVTSTVTVRLSFGNCSFFSILIPQKSQQVIKDSENKQTKTSKQNNS